MNKLKYILSLTFSLFVFAFSVKAQQATQPPDHLAVKSANWDIINDLTYKMAKDGSFVPVYTDRLKALDGKVIELKGYIVPLKMGAHHKNFAISVLPVSQCYFCGTGNIPPMVEVEMSNAIAYTDKIIVVKGKIKLNPTDTSKMEIILEKADLVN